MFVKTLHTKTKDCVCVCLCRVSDEQCVTIMSVRKGKRLISRLLPFLPAQQAAAVVMAIARNLPALAKKDKQDQVKDTHKRTH